MFQCNAITLKELQSIQSKYKKPVKAAEELLNIVTNQSSNVFNSFLDALKKTDHRHVFEVIVTGSYKGTMIESLRRIRHILTFIYIYIYLLWNIVQAVHIKEVIKKTKKTKKTLFRTQLFNNNVNVSTVKVQKNRVSKLNM